MPRATATQKHLVMVRPEKWKIGGPDERRKKELARCTSDSFERSKNKKRKNVGRRKKRGVQRVKSVEHARNKRPKRPMHELKRKQLNDANVDA